MPVYGISKSQIFYNVICIEYLNHKYLYQGYSMDSLFQSARGPCSAALRALQRLRARVATALFAPSFATAMRRSSVSATDRPPQRGLPRPNCHSHDEPLVDLVHCTLARDVASLPAQLVGCICQPMWRPAAPVLVELVWHGQSIVA